MKIKEDEDGTPLIKLDQDVIYQKDGKIIIDLGKMPFETDRFGKIIYPKKGESIKIEIEVELNDEGEWEEV